MAIRYSFAAMLISGLAAIPVPAFSEDWRYCMAIIKDDGGAERILLMSPVLPVASVPNFNQAWDDYIRPVAESAMRQHATRGSVVVRCTIGEARSETLSHRSKIISIVSRRGLLFEQVPWRPSVAGDATGRTSGTTISTGDDGSTGTEMASADSGAGDRANHATPEKPAAPKWIGAPNTPPPNGYSEWQTYARGAQYKGYSVPVRVDYAYRILDDEIRIVWRCTNESSVNLSCSVGGGQSKEYRCLRHNQTPLGVTKSLGERATVRAGSSYNFPSDWACRGLKANSFNPSVQIRWE